MLILALYPDQNRKLIQYSATRSRQHATLRARAICDGICPRALLTGPDICSQQGPLVSPDYLRREYWPLVEYAHQPLHDAGAKIVWHCDGDVRAILPDVLACGIGGLQGFQRECGVKLEELVDLRTRDGDPLLIMGPMSVTTTLPHGSPDQVRGEVRWAMDVCRDKASLVFFTSNTIIPDTPLENVKAYWQAVTESQW
jgi:uroporphyrinogen decarboxylase